jgi:hypothetical protein
LSFEQRLEKIAEEIVEIVIKKNKDYGNSFDLMIDKYGMIALLIRFQDKIGRLDSLVLKGQKQEVEDESYVDTLKDIVGYGLLALQYLEAKQADRISLMVDEALLNLPVKIDGQ